MKQRIFSIILIVTLLVSGCQGAQKEDASSNPPKTSEPTVTEPEAPLKESQKESSRETSTPEPSASPEVSEESSTPVIEEKAPSATPPAPDLPPDTKRSLEDVYPISDETVHAQLRTPLSELLTLDNTPIPWGPGPTSSEVRPAAPVDLQARYGAYGATFIAPDSSAIYLTFDEGYDAGYNSAILDTLKEKEVSAIFFVTLGFVQSRPDLVQRMVDEGHILGNHSWKHIAFPSMEPMDCAKDVLYLHNYVLENFGYEMTLCRPPEGAFSVRTLALLDALGYESMFWSFAYRDWILEEQPAPADALATIVGRSHPGAVYLLHAVSSTNATVLGDAIDQLRDKGYTIAPYPINLE